MICALASPVAPPADDELYNALSPVVVVLPTIHHCCVGAAFQRKIPPNIFKPRLRSALVMTFDGVRPVVEAALNTTTGLVTAWPLGLSKPSEAFGADVVSAEPPAAASNAVTREKIKPPRVDADASPEIRISSTSMIAVPLPPLIAIHCGVVGEVIAAPEALAIHDIFWVEKTRFAISILH